MRTVIHPYHAINGQLSVQNAGKVQVEKRETKVCERAGEISVYPVSCTLETRKGYALRRISNYNVRLCPIRDGYPLQAFVEPPGQVGMISQLIDRLIVHSTLSLGHLSV